MSNGSRVILKASHDGGQDGFAVVEMVLSVFIIVLVTLAAFNAVKAIFTASQNYREESSVRTALAEHLAYAERYLSLASGADGTESVWIVYPRETGGVAFETGHWVKVSGAMLSHSNKAMNFAIDSEDERWNVGTEYTQNQSFSGDGLLSPVDADVMKVTLEGSKDIRRLTLKAGFLLRIKGENLWTNITVCRPIRMWN